MERIDFHSHILPRADHGSDGIETSLAQLALLKEAGVRLVAATPHFSPSEQGVTAFLEKRARCVQELLPHLTKEHPLIALGAEVLVCPGMEKMEGLESLCAGGGRALLLEMPFGRLSDGIFYTIEALSARQDLQVVLAHIDRYHKDDVASVMSLPLLAQVNAESLCQRKYRKMLEPYFRSGQVSALGSDLHGGRKGGLKNYLKGLAKLTEDGERAVYSRTAALFEGASCLKRDG